MKQLKNLATSEIKEVITSEALKAGPKLVFGNPGMSNEEFLHLIEEKLEVCDVHLE